MVKLFRAELTATGRPVLLHGEVERLMLDRIDLLFYGVGGVEDQASEEYKGGYVVLTNYRLIWMSSTTAPQDGSSGSAAGVPCHLPLPAVSDAEHKAGMLLKNPRVKLLVRVDASRYPTADSRSVAAVSPLKLVCKGGSPDALHAQLQQALSSRAWASAPAGLLQQLLPVPLLTPAAGGAVPGRVAGGPLGAGLQGWSADAAPAAAAGSGGGGGLQPDWAIMEGLCAASFPRLQAINAVVATRNAGVQQAIEWILDNQGSPALDQPSPFLSSQPSPYASASVAATSSQAGGSTWMGPATASAQPAYPGWPPPPHAAGAAAGPSTFANPLLSSHPLASAGSSWDMLGSSGSSWELHSSGGAGLGLVPGGSMAGPAAAARGGGAGVGLILRREEQKAAATGDAMDGAFQDLDQLMRKAGEMVQLAQYFRDRVTRGAEAGGEEELDAETALDLLNLGIVSPVTRDTAGSLYHQELARQLADFLKAPVERASGMMPLPDVYCLYNRARGTELISPDDLLTAIKLFPRIRAPLSLREFASGVKVVQADSHSDEAICRRLAQMVQPAPTAAAAQPRQGEEGAPGGPATSSAAAMAESDGVLLAALGPSITSTEVAVGLGVPVPIAGEHLRTAEARGVLCRDDGPEGLRFFRNFFADASLAAVAG
uniref:Vacuolar protein-sorting-associated protein 36 n=1 Tax=Chlorella vulgaris TaxID=3077 RepID=A0A9D4YWJ8_CHLVU|nr:hypothetical protein D9Q98_005016 [Chlorella vulgaris]